MGHRTPGAPVERHSDRLVLPRHADTADVVGTALIAHATGADHRAVAAKLRRPQATVRRWLRAVGGQRPRVAAHPAIQATARLNWETLVGLVRRSQPHPCWPTH
jgi:hypothetical protein